MPGNRNHVGLDGMQSWRLVGGGTFKVATRPPSGGPIHCNPPLHWRASPPAPTTTPGGRHAPAVTEDYSGHQPLEPLSFQVLGHPSPVCTQPFLAGPVLMDLEGSESSQWTHPDGSTSHTSSRTAIGADPAVGVLHQPPPLALAPLLAVARRRRHHQIPGPVPSYPSISISNPYPHFP